MIVGILGPGGCGGTFLDWSLHYLAGDTKNIVVNCDPTDRGKILNTHPQDILENPIKNSTAHHHQKTHPNDKSIDAVIDTFKLIDSNLHTFYYVTSMGQGQTQTNHNDIINSYSDVKFITYVFKKEHIDLIFCLQYDKTVGRKNLLKHEIKVNDTRLFDELSVGEQRELISLYYPKCIKSQILSEEINPSTNNYCFNFEQIWQSLPNTMPEIFNFLDLSIDPARINHWKQIYKLWLEQNNIDFFNDIPYIVECILTGVSLDLSKYSMTFSKEVVLLSKLLYDHNLTLKFENFKEPLTNTVQWHDILETNVYHNLNEGKI